MQRYFIELAYNGRDFFGWQRQPKVTSVQEEIESAMTRLNSNVPVQIVGCGRTDTGVHAHHYMIHVDLEKLEAPENYVYKLNKMLPDSIALFSITPVSEDLHARFSATQRTYRYFIHQKKDPFKNELSWYLPKALDFEKMNEAAKIILGRQDFTSLSKLHTDVKTNICDVTKAEWVKTGDHEAYFEISADRFLRNMVRATVGTLVDVGLGRFEPAEVTKILDAKDRQAASTSVPGHGLFLWKIEYPNY